MEFENIKELVKLFDKSALSRLKIAKDDFSLDLEKSVGEVVVAAPKPVMVASPTVAAAAGEPVAAAPEQHKKGEIVTSPMVGTFYQAPSPDSPPYAKVGEIVKKGRPMAIIEAMKIMNEIEAEFDCKVLEILAQDGQPVEYDMPLFRVEKV